MIEIKDLLSRMSNILLGEEGKKESVRSAINEATGLDIKSEQIRIKNKVIYLEARPIYKNEVFLKKETIILKLKEVFGDKAPDDIL